MVQRLMIIFGKARHTQRLHDAKTTGYCSLHQYARSDIVMMCELYAWAAGAFDKHPRTNY